MLSLHMTLPMSNIWPSWSFSPPSLFISSVSFASSYSFLWHLNVGVLQGSVTDHILFSILNFTLLMRAHSSAIISLAQTFLLKSILFDPTDISTWLYKIYLKNHKSKTEFLICPPKPVSPESVLVYLKCWQHHLSRWSSQHARSHLWFPSYSHTPHPIQQEILLVLPSN